MTDITGSSPLARGLRGVCRRNDRMRRIIPARAGFTVLRLGYRDGVRDHPRSRGVYCARSRARMSAGGSSPLARGLRTRWPTSWCSPGIIPARAGFTARCRPGLCPRTDHPRSRGVYHGCSPSLSCWPGIIPARAGFTLADPRNPNDELPYQAMFTFTADLALAPQSSDSAVVSQRSTTTPSEA